MLRLLGILTTVLIAIGVAVLTWPSFFRVDRMFPIAQIVPFRGPLLVVFAAVAVLALLIAMIRPIRAFALSLALIFGIGTVALAGTVYVRGGAGTDALPEKSDTSVRVMTWNTAGDATPPDTIAKIAVAMNADIIALPETTIETGEQVAITMGELGHPMWAHHTEYGDDGWDASSTTLLISPDMGDYAVIESSVEGVTNTSTLPSAVAAPTNGSGPIVVVAHAVAPRPYYMQEWRDDLRWLADQCGDASVIMAGDFNATVDHFSGLGTDGATLGSCDDAAVATGNGVVGTWPSSVPALAGAPIDHVMATDDWRATGSVVLRSLDDSGSDHRPLIVQLEPAG